MNHELPEPVATFRPRRLVVVLVAALLACNSSTSGDASADAATDAASDAASDAARDVGYGCMSIDPPTPDAFVFEQCALTDDASVGCSAPPTGTFGGVALDAGQQAYPAQCRITWPATNWLSCTTYFCTCQGSDMWICPQ